jgi:hypothetical protein
MNFVCRIQTKTILSRVFSYVEYSCLITNRQLELDTEKPLQCERVHNNDFTVFIQTNLESKKGQKWLVADDFVQRSGFKPEKIENVSTYFDLRICKQDVEKVLEHRNQITRLLGCNFEPLALYHGSGADKLSSILQSGLKQSFGMLGNAVYLGTFYKACRYASRQQNYSFRSDGVIFRCLAFAQTISQYPSFTHTCQCEKCRKEVSGFEKVSDHLSTWNRGEFCAVEVCVSEQPFGFKRTGEPKYLSKNAEWGFRDECVEVKDYLHLDISSIMGPEYHPLQRNCRCIW